MTSTSDHKESLSAELARTRPRVPGDAAKWSSSKDDAESLDPTLLSLRDDERDFFASQTGIFDEEELRVHILRVQRLAYAVAPYPCIRRFGFTRLKISRHPVYQQVLSLARSQEDGLLLDLACCVGNDARKIVADGWPAERAWATDLHPEFWPDGHELFSSSAETCKISFIAGDLFDDQFLNWRDNLAADETVRPASLTPLRGRFVAIHVGAFFHLFGLERQSDAAVRCLSLLSTSPGSVIFGSNIGSEVAGSQLGALPHLHNPQSWTQMWQDASRKLGHEVEVEAKLVDFEGYLGQGVARATRQVSGSPAESGGGRPGPMQWLVWSIRRSVSG